ncbi:class I SAM-dependent methyltransferase [Clostridium lacusfryxellense]|uniref:class I SAM-dependent methyltransferase n=1 Tax=Clostridium lacusfryxellense TaxID=205328 RepID=UPI001C0DEFBD|nr:class I SAM-dependent methyltransferase [Clostridium lacusfryxellense]MBU3114005.1 methyltransferase domain-containing protein [Clostridium lacusfryxellense]
MKKHQHNLKEMQQLSRTVGYLDSPERIKAFPPKELLQMLPIKKTDNILDLGAGTGYLAITAAQMVDGLVYALDMNPKMLDIIESKAQDENITNIQLVKGSIDDIPLPDNSIDIVLASLVLHEVSPLSKTIKQIKRVLKEGGYFLCVEFEKTESVLDGPPMHIRIPSANMEEELINAGFSIIQKLFPSDLLYIFIVKK